MAESSGGMPDPLAMWKQMVDSQDEVWSKALQDMMGTEAFAAAMGRSLENLTSVQSAINRALDQHYRTLNLPSRTDVTRLAEEVAELRAVILRLGDRVEELADRRAGEDRPAARSAPPRPPAAPSPGTRARRPADPAGGARAPGKKPADRPSRSGGPPASE